MPPKRRPPAPIDRPLSKAYLREFDGWSTAYPPGLSEPNSLRVMENVQVTREGAARVRPGLRSYLRTKSPLPIVGSHELFYLPSGKAYLVAVRETVDVGTEDEREIVSFRVIGHDDTGELVMDTLEAFGFEVPADPHALSFTSATTYVKYLQIDNKIFALSNAPEGMLMFWVGTERKAKKLQSIERPDWSVGDKLSAMQPTSTWVLNNVASSTRTNLCTNPDFETGVFFWSAGGSLTRIGRSADESTGSWAARLSSEPARVNWLTRPLGNVPVYGIEGWVGYRANLSTSGDSMSIIETATTESDFGYAKSDMFTVPSGKTFKLAFDLTSYSNVERLRAFIAWYRSDQSHISSTDVMNSSSVSVGRKVTGSITIPTQAAFAKVLIGPQQNATNVSARINIKDVYFGEGDTAALDGDDAGDNYWVGDPNNGRSEYHPPTLVYTAHDQQAITPGTYTFSVDLKGASGRTVILRLRARNSSGSVVATQDTSFVDDGTYSRHSVTLVAPSTAVKIEAMLLQLATARNEYLIWDAALIEQSATADPYFSGNTANAGTTKRRWLGGANQSQSVEEVFDPVLPTAQTPGADTLVSSTASKNRHSFSFFYTISNELGESAASQVTTIKVQRPWTAWQWLDPNGVETDDPNFCADQLVVLIPQEVFDYAVASGATHWSAYYYYQGPNDAPSVTATRFAEIDLSSEPAQAQHGYARLTPQLVKIGLTDPLVPSESSRFNSSNPVKGSQGLVAADRLILVGNPDDPARISWSSGAPGDYHNFSPLLGGGSKQLTSGNLYVTGCVKLWQNTQSVDTLTVLNFGDDGRSNAYYMQPAQITSLSESISVMGFEEVSALQGTVSPYGVEVVNNGLYTPLFHGLFKSTANNYNLSTKPVSDTIQNMWRALQTPHRIVSSQLDSRIYYLVHNIFGDPLEADCRGNEVWVIDLAAKTPSWSRWKVQGVSLRAMDVDDVVMMSIVRPDGIFVFNEDAYTDERFNPDTDELEKVNISWYLETNTQGANRAHDAWCNLQQSNIMVGNFHGQMRYGIRGQDVNGKPVSIEKVLLSTNPPPTEMGELERPTLFPTEREDYLLIQKTIKEWVFFAGSVDDVVDDVTVPRFSGGQVNAVQYRYVPATVNVGYEYGSVETFEYGQSAQADATTDSGTPKPYVDLSRT